MARPAREEDSEGEQVWDGQGHGTCLAGMDPAEVHALHLSLRHVPEGMALRRRSLLAWAAATRRESTAGRGGA